MPFSSVADFLSMGGHAFYVWTVVVAFLLLLIINLASPIWLRRRIQLRVATQRQLNRRQGRNHESAS